MLREYLVRGAAIVGVGRVLALLLGLAATALMTRLLPPSEIGLLFLLLTLVGVASTLGQLGLSRNLVLRVGEAGARSHDGESASAAAVILRSLTLAALGGVAVMLLLAGGPGLGLVGLLGSEATPWVMVWVGLLAAARVLEAVVGDSFRSLRRLASALLFGFLLSRLLLFLGLAAMAAGFSREFSEARIGHVLVITFAAAAVSALAGGVALRWHLRGPSGASPPSYRSLLSSSWPILVSTALTLISESCGVWIISATTQDETQVALFGTALRISILVGFPLMIANGVLMPLIARLYARGERDRLGGLLRLSASVTALPAILLALLYFAVGRPLLAVLFGDFYSQSWTMLLLLSLTQLLNVWTGSCGLTLLMTGSQRLHLRLNLLSLAVMLVAGMVLTGAFGALGMCFAVLVASLFQQLIFLVFARRRTGLWTCGTLRLDRLRTSWHDLAETLETHPPNAVATGAEPR